VKKPKPITLLLLLFFLLLITCTWCYVDKILEKKAMMPSTVAVEDSTPSNELKHPQEIIPTAPIKPMNPNKPLIKENIKPTKTIFYSIRKENNQITLEGTLNSIEEEKLLVTAINHKDLVKAINIEPQLVPNKGDLLFTQELLKTFKSDYSQGFISYENRTFTIGGVVKNETLKMKMNQLLQSHSDTFNNYTTVQISKEDLKEKEEALAYEKMQEREKKALEKKKMIEETLQLEKEQEAVDKARAKIKQKELHKEEAKLLEADIKTIIDSENIRFKSGQSMLTHKSKETIKKIAQLLEEHPTVQIKISGHTDSSGDAKRNLKLSQSRVNAVKDALIKLNINTHRLKAVGYGAEQPLVSNDSKENREINRRVEFKIIGE